jgi:hypothetical protein
MPFGKILYYIIGSLIKKPLYSNDANMSQSLIDVARQAFFEPELVGYCAFCGAETDSLSQVCLLHAAQVPSIFLVSVSILF